MKTCIFSHDKDFHFLCNVCKVSTSGAVDQMCVYVCVRLYLCTCVYVCVYVCVCLCVYVYESESHSVVSNSLQTHGLWNSPGQNTGLGSLSLLQGIFPTQESNPGLPHCRYTLYQLSHREAPCMYVCVYIYVCVYVCVCVCVCVCLYLCVSVSVCFSQLFAFSVCLALTCQVC